MADMQMPIPSPGLIGLTSASSLDQKSFFWGGPALYKRLKDNALEFYKRWRVGLRDQVPLRDHSIDHVISPDLAAVEASLEKEYAEGVAAIAAHEAAKQSAGQSAPAAAVAVEGAQLPDPEKVQALLSQFEVVPPASENTAGALAAANDAKKESDGGAKLAEVRKFPGNLYDPSKIERELAEEDELALAEEGLRREAEERLAQDPVAGGPVAGSTAAPQMPHSLQVAAPSAAQIIASGMVAGVAGTANLVTAPGRMVSNAIRSLGGKRREEQARSLVGAPAGTTLQSLTLHNIAGMEKTVAELHVAVKALHADAALGRVLKDIKSIAKRESKDEAAVLREVRPGGRYEYVCQDWETAIDSNPKFAEFERVSRDLIRRMARDQPKLGNTSEELLLRYNKSVEDGMFLAKGIPSRRGIDDRMLESLHSKFLTFSQALQKVVEKIKGAFSAPRVGDDDPNP